MNKLAFLNKKLSGYSLVAAFFFSLYYLLTNSLTHYNSKDFSEYLRESGNPKEITLVDPEYESFYKQINYIIEEDGKTDFFNRKSISIKDDEKEALFVSYKSAGIRIFNKKSFFISVRYRPASFLVLQLFLFIGMFGLSYIAAEVQKEKQAQTSLLEDKLRIEQQKNKKVSEKTLSFNDIAGIDEVKDQIMEIVSLFKDSSKIEEMGGKIPRGILLNGPPGTGKTLLAKVTARECSANFIHASGSEFVEMYVGVGAKRIRDLFSKAKNKSPCIIFIDEIDAVAGRRGIDQNSEREQTLNELLVQMDGFSSNENILVFAATNQLEKLDPAILRPGRFDRQISVHLPDAIGREKILKIYIKKTKHDNNVDLGSIARATSGFSGADLSNLVNEAVLYAARSGNSKISQKDLVWAKDKIVMGSERRLKLKSDELEKTAYHEIGHAFICKKLSLGNLVNVSIVPRGNALGVTQMESEDTYSISREKAVDQISMLLGGRACEKLFFDHLSTGASSDLRRAYSLAKSMVVSWGMSEFGPIGVDETSYRLLSETTKAKIDLEIMAILKSAEEKANQILKDNSDLVKELSLFLLSKETITAEQFNEFECGYKEKHLKQS
jgi:cell division protease FtsH